jgi:predicted DCC family thiol-disulfide oxidoreductase YuxK
MARITSSSGTELNTEGLEVFFDGHCPICTREINLLRRLDRHSLIKFTDITDEGFDGPKTINLTYNELMASIHGRLSDGTVIEGMEVFRQLYARTVFKPLVSLTRLPGLSWLLDRSYSLFAWLRFRSRGGPCKDDGTCGLTPAAKPPPSSSSTV